MKIKKAFLVFAFVAVSIIALLYGVNPDWFAATFLNIPELNLNIAHILRAMMCLYLALGLFWLYAAFNDKYRDPALIVIIIFCAGLVVGRVLSVILDGIPSPLLILYIAMEFSLVPIGIWIYKLKD
jgi:hypothetical protein